jgi:hypothetical protein
MASISSATTWGEGRTDTWTPLTETNTDGIPVSAVGSGDRCFEATGTFGGATIVLQGSNDASNWYTLKDPGGTAISLTSTGLRQVLENPRYLRPLVSGGSGTSLTAILFTRKSKGK